MSYTPNTTSVSAFGAIGNGLADDTAAITRAITAAGVGGVVLFEPGRTYKTTASISIPHDSLTLMGYGATITSADNTQWVKFSFTGRTKGAVRGLTFNCLYATASGQANATIDIGDSSEITVEDCSFNDSPLAVRVCENSARCIVQNNRFYKCFLAIFFDDDGGSEQPTFGRISGNIIRTGLGATTDSFSGAIKISGIGGDINLVISNNIIDTPGEMGIEVQGPDQFIIEGNIISGAAFGISVSESDRATVTGNTVKACTYVAIEVASNSKDAIVSSNIIRQGAVRSIQVVSSSSNVSIVGNNVFNTTSEAVYMAAGQVSVNDNYFGGAAGLYAHGVGNISVIGNTFAGSGAAAGVAFTIDATDRSLTGFMFSNNRITGGFSNSLVFFYTPGVHTINDMLIEGNNTKGCACAAWTLNATNPLLARKIRCRDNIGDGTADSMPSDLSVPTWNLSTTQNYPYGYYFFEGAVVNMDATAAARGFQLPLASGMGGYQMTVRKTDAFNPVLISGYAGATIDGFTAVSLNAQRAKMTFYADGVNWIILNSGVG